MYNWNIDTNNLKKNPEKYKIWKLEQSINFGLNGQKLNKLLRSLRLGLAKTPLSPKSS